MIQHQSSCSSIWPDLLPNLQYITHYSPYDQIPPVPPFLHPVPSPLLSDWGWIEFDFTNFLQIRRSSFDLPGLSSSLGYLLEKKRNVNDKRRDEEGEQQRREEEGR
ncbi:hypothetical protein Droror1_Dr00015762 [Drosera rotundifolia]